MESAVGHGKFLFIFYERRALEYEAESPFEMSSFWPTSFEMFNKLLAMIDDSSLSLFLELNYT